MSMMILGWALILAKTMLIMAMSLAGYRILRGKRSQDRVLGLDTLYATSMMLILTIGIETGNTLYFEAALLIALLGFASTMALGKFLMRGEVIE